MTCNVTAKSADKAHAYSVGWWVGCGHRSGVPKTYTILKFVADSVMLDSFLLELGSILDPMYEMWD